MITVRSFNLLRFFAVLSLLTISLTGALSGYALYLFLRVHLMERDATVSMEFIQSIARINDPEPYFRGSQRSGDRVQLEEFFRHITQIPGVLRATVYAADGSIIWSDDEDLIGMQFRDNDDLQVALQGQLKFELGHAGEFRICETCAIQLQKSDADAAQISASNQVISTNFVDKIEYAFLPEYVSDFIESYIPIWDNDRHHIIGVVELYKAPTALFRALDRGKLLVVVISALGGVLLYVTLFWIVRRADALIQRQQQALVEAEQLSMVGEMVSSITHSLRNPLAAIRSSAELTLLDSDEAVQEYAQDIVNEVDRLDRWVRTLLLYSHNNKQHLHHITVADALSSSIENFADRPTRQGVLVTLELPASLPPVCVESEFLIQVCNGLIANALEAMPNGGRLTINGESRDDNVIVRLSDTGAGIPKQQLQDIFRPLISHKSGGLGVGLPLARRILQRHGGDLKLISRQGGGTTVVLQLPVADG